MQVGSSTGPLPSPQTVSSAAFRRGQLVAPVAAASAAPAPAGVPVPRPLQGEWLPAAAASTGVRPPPPAAEQARQVAEFYARHSAAALDNDAGELVAIDVYV